MVNAEAAGIVHELHDPFIDIKIIDVITSEFIRIDLNELEEHLHPDGDSGGSGVTSCIWKDAMRMAGIIKTVVEGIKAHKGGLWVGKWMHLKLQDTLKEYYNRMKEKNPELVYVEEIYAPFVLLDEEKKVYDNNGEYITTIRIYVRIVSPIDVAFLSKPGYVMKELKFKNMTMKVPMLAPGAKFLQIFDIKSAGNIGYYLMHKNGLNFGYKGQFHIYMFPAKLNQITCLDIHKEKAHMFTIKCNWDDQVWETMKNMMRRKIYLVWLFKKNEQLRKENKPRLRIKIRQKDFNCIWMGTQMGTGTIEWYSCPLNFCHEEKDYMTGAPKLVLDQLCVGAQKMQNSIAKRKFLPDTVWKYGSSIVTVIKYLEKEGKIFAINKSGTQFHITVHKAIQKMKPYE